MDSSAARDDPEVLPGPIRFEALSDQGGVNPRSVHGVHAPGTQVNPTPPPRRTAIGYIANSSRPWRPTTVQPEATPIAAPKRTSLAKWRLSVSREVATYPAISQVGQA